jgi:deoxyribodipyrimidine photo-lyase
MSHEKTIFIFHRSLRLNDNLGLIEALKMSNHVIPIFIFTPEQITSKNKFRSINAIKFMIESLKDLNNSLREKGSKLYIFYGKQEDILESILNSDPEIDAVYVNKDYTPYAVDREKKLQKVCEKKKISFKSLEDYLLHPIDTINNLAGNFYSVFTPFYRAGLKLTVSKPKSVTSHTLKKFIKSKYHIDDETTFDAINEIYLPETETSPLYEFEGTRKEALKRIKNLKYHKNYSDHHNDLFLETTRLAPYIKFGLISIREVYDKVLKLFGKSHDLIRQLYWREFYYILSYNRPDMLQDSSSFRLSYDKIKWTSSKNYDEMLLKWKKGETGCPVVDAGMRELNYTGYMHNRSRLITSNYLVKHLFIDWREGERYYASKLIDYDPSINNGNWQFTSGSGADSQPFFRMMNPWTQGERHDEHCGYIKTWIPELANVENEDIHVWQDTYKKYHELGVKYPEPIKKYDFAKLKQESKKIYSKAFN